VRMRALKPRTPPTRHAGARGPVTKGRVGKGKWASSFPHAGPRNPPPSQGGGRWAGGGRERGLRGGVGGGGGLEEKYASPRRCKYGVNTVQIRCKYGVNTVV
jgi:hypothetical protein